VVIIGYGSQGHAMRSICAIRRQGRGVALRKGSAGVGKAEGEKLKVMEVAEAAKWADVMMMLTPTSCRARSGAIHLSPNMKQGAALMFAHGLNIHFNLIEPRPDLDVMMIAPKGPGHYGAGRIPARRRRAGADGGASRRVRQCPRSHSVLYGSAIGGGRAGIIETTFREECETDLFGEQAVLCGGLVELMKAALRDAGRCRLRSEMAYFECVHEVKLIVDLI